MVSSRVRWWASSYTYPASIPLYRTFLSFHTGSPAVDGRELHSVPDHVNCLMCPKDVSKFTFIREEGSCHIRKMNFNSTACLFNNNNNNNKSYIQNRPVTVKHGSQTWLPWLVALEDEGNTDLSSHEFTEFSEFTEKLTYSITLCGVVTQESESLAMSLPTTSVPSSGFVSLSFLVSGFESVCFLV